MKYKFVFAKTVNYYTKWDEKQQQQQEITFAFKNWKDKKKQSIRDQ